VQHLASAESQVAASGSFFFLFTGVRSTIRRHERRLGSDAAGLELNWLG
jgi:hypothetical protein